MADNSRNYIGIAMGLDVTDLKAGLQETKKEIQTANKQFAAATSGMDDWKKSSDGLSAKLEQLDKVLVQQKKNVAGIEAELKKAKEQYGDNSEQVRRLTDKLLDAQAAVGKTEKAQRKYTKALEEVEADTKDVTDATDKMSRGLKDADDATEQLKGGFTVLKGVVAGLVTTGINALVGGLANAVEESREFRQELAYLEQGAEDAGVSFEKAKDKVRDVFAVFGEEDSAVEGLNNLMTAGFDGAALDQITDQLTGAAVKWHDTLKFEGLADGLQETLATGKAIGPFVELLERGGIVAEDFDAGLAAATTTAEKQQYVLDTLSKLGLEEVADGYREANKSLIESQEAQFNYNETMGQVGERVEPVFTTIKQGWADVLDAILLASDGVDLEALKTGIKDAFTWFIDEGIPLIKEFAQFVVDNKDIILGTITGIGAAFAAWQATTIIQGATAAMKTLWVTTEGMTVAQKLLNLAMKANPIGIVITIIAGLVAAFITLWNTSDEFRGFWIGLWDKIKAAVKPVIDWIGKAFSTAWSGIKKTWSVVADWFKGVWNKIKSIFSPSAVKSSVATPFSNAWNAIKAVWNAVTGYFKLVWSNIKSIFKVVKSVLSGDFRGAWNGIKDIWNNSKSYFSGIIDTIFGYFGDLPDKLISIGRDMIDGLVQGIKNAAGKVTDAAKEIGRKAVNAFENVFDIGSPSKLMHDKIGMMLGAGIGEGILDSSKIVNKDINKFGDSLDTELGTELTVPIEEPNCDELCEPALDAWTLIKNAWNLAPEYFSGIWNRISATFSVVPNTIREYFENAWMFTQTTWNNAPSYFTQLSDNIQNVISILCAALESEFSRAMDNIIADVNRAIAAVRRLKAEQGIASSAGQSVGAGVSQGIAQGITSNTKPIISGMVSGVTQGVNTTQKVFGIHSPSTVTRDEIGVPLAEGIAVGLLSSLGNVKRDLNKFVAGLQANISDIQGGLSLPVSTGNRGVMSNNNSVVNNTYNQVINAPKQPSRIELYRQTKNLLAMRGGHNV